MNGQPNPMADPSMAFRHTVRLEMHEVYEEDGHLLIVTSDALEARRSADKPGDKIVTCWWVREGER